MIHELYVYWIMFWSMPEWIIAMVFFGIIFSLMLFTNKINVSK